MEVYAAAAPCATTIDFPAAAADIFRGMVATPTPMGLGKERLLFLKKAKQEGFCNSGAAVSAFVPKAALLVCHLASIPAAATELCHYTGVTDYAGRLTLTTAATTAAGATTVDVAADFEATSMMVLHLHYMVEEISLWRDGVMQHVAMNTRDAVNGHVVRQLWDRFDRVNGTLQGQRIQGKTPADFARKHPGFAAHWTRADFAHPWLADFAHGAPERRPDLDFSPAPPTLRPPMALAFYWVRFLPPGGATVPVFMPGFKADKSLELAIAGHPTASGAVLRAPLRYAWFSAAPLSTVAARVSPDHHLQILGFEVHGPRGSARGAIHQETCSGTP
jgi:hypothetical protein